MTAHDERDFHQEKRLRRAVQELRTRLGLTQTQFGDRLGKGLASVQRYESLAPPKGSVLAQLMQIASEIGTLELAHVFQEALSTELGFGVPLPRSGTDPNFMVQPGEQSDFDALAEILRNPSRVAERKGWNEFAAPVKSETAQAEMLRLRNEGIWNRKKLDAIGEEVRAQGLHFGAINIETVAQMREFILGLKSQGKTGEEITRLIGLEEEVS